MTRKPTTGGADPLPESHFLVDPIRLPGPGWIALVLPAGWVIAFFWWFFTPGTVDGPVDRFTLLANLPELLADNIQPTSDSGWRYLPQRFDLILTASFLLAGCWAIGRWVLRRIGIERDRFSAEDLGMAIALGCSLLSLIVLGLGMASWLSRWVLIGILTAALLAVWQDHRKSSASSDSDAPKRESLLSCPKAIPRAVLLFSAPFVLAMLLGAMLPSTDFDVKEYHLEGPKEFFLNKKIGMLEHNVYTSFPFLTEMLSLSAMVVHDDWDRGARAGKLLLMCYAVVASLGIFSLGRMLFGTIAGWLALFVYLTTPWIFRISIIAYTEGGLSAYLVWALFAAVRSLSSSTRSGKSRWMFLAGFLAGSAASCKYPAVLSVVLPVGLLSVMSGFDSHGQDLSTDEPKLHRLKPALWCLLGGLIAFGPWLLKNTFETGNPVYPLLWPLLGGRSFDAEIHARWQAAHSPPWHLLHSPAQILPDLLERLKDVMLHSKWQSPLMFGLAPVSLLMIRKNHSVRGLWIYCLWLFLSWCWLTHRIDRFWVPMLPIVALLAGQGGSILFSLSRRALSRSATPLSFGLPGLLALAILSATAFNLVCVTSGFSGLNAFLMEESKLTTVTETSTVTLARHAIENSSDTVLFVGEAAVFDADFSYRYNTVFDHSLFVEWFADVKRFDAQTLAPPQVIRQKLQEQGIRYLAVNWKEVLRYRLPGSYGFPDLVHPSRFDQMTEQGLLRRLPWVYQMEWDALSESEQNLIQDWAPELHLSLPADGVFRAIEIYEVIP